MAGATVAEALAPVVKAMLGGDPPVEVRAWDGSALGRADAPARVVLRSPQALRRVIFAPNELGLGRAYVAGELDLEGDMLAAVALLRDRLADADGAAPVEFGVRTWAQALRGARRIGALGWPPPPPPEEARLSGRRHSKNRDAAAVSHHYDVSNDFYALVLGPSMTYSCAYFPRPGASLEEAQAAKHELICRKLGLRPGMRLLDVGCGWGEMALHAARHHGVEVVGITVSRRQQELAAKRVAEAGCGGCVEVRLQDYRDLGGETFDAISSVGMFEHVGLAHLEAYFATLHEALRPGGRLLNHAISRLPGPAPVDRHSFIERYVFPDGELHEVGAVASAMQTRGFEVRDVQSLREHYALTLRAWVANLERSWDDAVALAGSARARIWRLYMAGAALNFEAGRTSVHQVLGVKPGTDGWSGLPLAREA